MKKKEKILAKIKQHAENHLYARITRITDKKNEQTVISRGYIVKYTEDFILLKEDDDFMFMGYNLIPVQYIKRIRYNKNDQYYDFIFKSEYPEDAFKLDVDLEIDLSSWQTFFQSVQKTDKPIISECEKWKQSYFTIGGIASVNETSVYINYFDAQGRLDKEPVEHKFKWITKVTFDDNYSKVFSKYIKE